MTLTKYLEKQNTSIDRANESVKRANKNIKLAQHILNRKEFIRSKEQGLYNAGFYSFKEDPVYSNLSQVYERYKDVRDNRKYLKNLTGTRDRTIHSIELDWVRDHASYLTRKFIKRTLTKKEYNLFQGTKNVDDAIKKLRDSVWRKRISWWKSLTKNDK